MMRRSSCYYKYRCHGT